VDFRAFFTLATKLPEPFNYQERFASEPWPDLLEIPTGMGKTAAVALTWAWKRGWREGARPAPTDPQTPRRLIWCLPMRVLVEQTREAVEQWLGSGGLSVLGQPGEGKVSVHGLMGGEADIKTWAEYPEEEMILIGTQDMLLSRALMRGYGMSRFLWPVHFAFLHNDCLWAFDEVQLMGAGLTTSTQIEAFRRNLPLGAASRSLWLSATLRRDWLSTVDFRPALETARHFQLSDDERASPHVRSRREAIKRLQRATTRLTQENAKTGAVLYAAELAGEVSDTHRPGTQTLVVLNTVERAQALYRAMEKRKQPASLVLVHARFRQTERQTLNRALRSEPDPNGPGRILIATQAIEAGVDISSRTLFTEIAPWSSLVQRFGRCNRYGEWNDDEGADAFWIDVDEGLAAPYEDAAVNAALELLHGLDSAAPARLPPPTDAAPLTAVLRRRDFLDLFNTDPDLSGFDVDIAPYIRDSDDLDVQVFWRDLNRGAADQPHPTAAEICRASLSQFRRYADKRKAQTTAYRWDALQGQWRPLREPPHPGMTLMLDAHSGGYDSALGFSPEQAKPVPVLTTSGPEAQQDAFQGEHLNMKRTPVTLADHLRQCEQEASRLAASLALADRDRRAVELADRWHDVGKAHPAFQTMLLLSMGDAAGPWGSCPLAKGSGSGRPY
jgi:CRISPR-associated endonuclease/helicase Cas3